MRKFCNQVNILHFIEGAKQAQGLTVIIDVFRAFSLECYLYDMGVKEIRPVGMIEEAFELKKRLKDSVLIGERHGKVFWKVPNCGILNRGLPTFRIMGGSTSLTKQDSISILRLTFGCV